MNDETKDNDSPDVTETITRSETITETITDVEKVPVPDEQPIPPTAKPDADNATGDPAPVAEPVDSELPPHEKMTDNSGHTTVKPSDVAVPTVDQPGTDAETSDSETTQAEPNLADTDAAETAKDEH